MGKAKRCRSVVIGASVAALGTAGLGGPGCPTADAASAQPVAAASAAPPTSTQRLARVGRSPKTYTYKFSVIAGEGPRGETWPAVCSAQSAVFPHAFLHEANMQAVGLIHYHDGEPTRFNVTLNTSTRIVAKGQWASRVRGLPKSVSSTKRPSAAPRRA